MKIDIFTIIVYVILILITIYVVYAEQKDIRCSDTAGAVCDDNNGRAFAHGRPNVGDTKEQLLDKVMITARYDMNSIHWRRAFIAAAVSSILVLYTLNNKLPDGIKLLTSFIIIYIIVYLTATLFQRWVAEPALNQMDDILVALKSI